VAIVEEKMFYFSLMADWRRAGRVMFPASLHIWREMFAVIYGEKIRDAEAGG
jgi:hypothetical protein